MDLHDDLDSVDVVILKALQEEGRLSWTRLAELIGMSSPSTTERVHRLQQRGYIQSFHAHLNPEMLGSGTLGFVALSVRDTARHTALLDRVREVPEIQEAHVVAGEYDYLLKIRCRTPEALATLLRDQVRNLPGVYRTNTIMVLEVVKESSGIPVPRIERRSARPTRGPLGGAHRGISAHPQLDVPPPPLAETEDAEDRPGDVAQNDG